MRDRYREDARLLGLRFLLTAALLLWVAPPADPVIAAGPDRLVTVTNDGIALLTKGGSVTATQTLSGFFAASYDPRIVYDPHSNRFFVVALSVDFLRLAVSKSGSPTNLRAGAGGDWWRFDIDGHDEPVGSSPRTIPDFDGLGVDQYNIYITARPASSPAGRS